MITYFLALPAEASSLADEVSSAEYLRAAAPLQFSRSLHLQFVARLPSESCNSELRVRVLLFLDLSPPRPGYSGNSRRTPRCEFFRNERSEHLAARSQHSCGERAGRRSTA